MVILAGVEGAQFTLKSIFIATDGAGGKQEGVIALACGPLAIAMTHDGEWTLTHLDSGMRVSVFVWWDDAASAASLLAKEDWSAAALADPERKAALGAVIRKVLAEIEIMSRLSMVDPKGEADA